MYSVSPVEEKKGQGHSLGTMLNMQPLVRENVCVSWQATLCALARTCAYLRFPRSIVRSDKGARCNKRLTYEVLVGRYVDGTIILGCSK